MPLDLPFRPRRLRATAASRALVRETRLSPDNFIYPMFVEEGTNLRRPIDSMPGQFRVSIDELCRDCEEVVELGIPAVNLFGYCTDKHLDGREAWNPEAVIPTAIRRLKKEFPQLCVQTDVALDPYTTTGHDGIVIDGEIVNDESVEALTRQALCHAEAGVDWVSPSDMMDGRVGVMRSALDAAGHQRVGILAYSAKYASSYYGPFRGALDSAPGEGDKKTYQMDPANVREAIREIALDIEQGADVVMVKPALAYLDVIAAARAEFDTPIAAYNVSGEYAMIIAAADRGWLDRDAAMMEMLLSIRRAGADMILTYFAKDAAKILRANS